MNPEPSQNDCKSPRGRPKKIKVFKGTPEKCDVNEKITVNVVSGIKVHNVFLNTVEPVSLNQIKPWIATCSDTIE